MNKIDHIVVAARDLQQGIDYVSQMLGVKIPAGGFHQTMGTHNHLMQLGGEIYLEVIAINPQASIPLHPRWFALDQALMRDSLQHQARLITWVMNCSDLAALVTSLDFEIGKATALSRDHLRWEFALPDDGRLLAAGLLPYCIQWHSSPHPSAAMADLGCRLQSLTLHHNRPQWLTSRLRMLGAEKLVAVAALPDHESPFLEAKIQRADGSSISLSSRQ